MSKDKKNLFIQHLNSAMDYLYRARYVVTDPMDTDAFHDVVRVQETLQKVLSRHQSDKAARGGEER